MRLQFAVRGDPGASRSPAPGGDELVSACGGECYHRAATAGVGYTGVLPDVCRNRKSLIGLVLEVFADLVAARPDVLRRLAAKDFSPVAPREQAFAAQDLGAYRS